MHFDEQRAQTIKIQTLIRATEAFELVISLEPYRPVLYSIEEVKPVPVPPQCPPIAYHIQLEVSIVVVVNLLLLWVMKKR